MTIKQIIKKFLPLCGIKHLSNLYKQVYHKNLVYNVNKATKGKRCLLIYITEPFYSKNASNKHQNQWQAREMARIIGTRGFIVDVANYQCKYLKLKHNYDLIVGLIPRGIDIYSNNMNPGCRRVAYLTSMNLSVTTDNERKRLEDLRIRRGVSLEPRRGSDVVIDRIIESFDAVWYIGNEYNFHSYDCFRMPPSYRIINTGYVFPWADPDIVRNPHCFMYFGSAGQVHKGLDLLLELFAEEISDCTLYVCGSFVGESDFVQEYHKELYETNNIISLGFLDINSQAYRHLSNQCAYSILPSCAEGCAGSVLTNMSAGIIPIVSRECGFEEDEVISLPDCHKATIKDFIMKYSNKDPEWIKAQSHHSIEVVKMRYSENAFIQSVKTALDGVLNRGLQDE